MTRRKGIILAGGSGTRLRPATNVVCKQLLPIYDKPMIYYPLSVLLLAGLREILIVTTPEDQQRFKTLLGTGSQWGIQFSYEVQHHPNGIAEALVLAEPFLSGSSSALVLGDNVFFGNGLVSRLQRACRYEAGATIFTYPVANPEQFGIVELDSAGHPRSITEKPELPGSNLAVTGLYFYDSQAPEIARDTCASHRGEREITDVNRAYLDAGQLRVEQLGRGDAWLDTGTHDRLLQASMFVETIESRQGLKLACPEEIVWRQGWIDDEAFSSLADALSGSSYGGYLRRLLRERPD
jgi:glucose-1-phosphate thymidylyltransferase